MPLNRFVVPLCLFLGVGGLVLAGDSATFQNLGFSEDSRYFMFAQYGASEEDGLPYAEAYTVDVRDNRFVPGGSQKASYTTAIEPGNDGQGALFNLLEQALPLKKRYGIDHTRSGRLVYILLNGAEPQSDVEFRDFATGRKYHITLNQAGAGSGAEIRASFHLVVTVTEASGTVMSHTVGLPDYWRTGVKRYRLKQVLLAPDNRSLVFVIEREEQGGTGANIRYMVETMRP
jgi:predicted secreted protein